MAGKFVGDIKLLNEKTLAKKEPGILLALENGDILIEEVKKAQQQITELNKTLEHIKHFEPHFRMK